VGIGIRAVQAVALVMLVVFSTVAVGFGSQRDVPQGQPEMASP